MTDFAPLTLSTPEEHPFAPFVTETIWQTLNYTTGILMREKWPTPEQFDTIAAEQFEKLKELVNEGRWVISELPGNAKYRLLYGNDSLIEDNQATIQQTSLYWWVEMPTTTTSSKTDKP